MADTKTLLSTIEPALTGFPEYEPRPQDVRTVSTTDASKIVATVHVLKVVGHAGWTAWLYGAATIRWHDGRVSRFTVQHSIEVVK